MNKKLLSFVLFALALLVIIAGCTRRENPVIPDAPAKGTITQGTHQYDGLASGTALWSQFPSRWVSIYFPAGYDPNDINGARYPVLYLLPGYDGEPSFYYQHGNEYYYETSGIGAIADELIASGEIKPMVIVMPDASIYYGGSFFNNNSTAGNWEDMMAVELLDYIENPHMGANSQVRVLAGKESHAIGGHSSGGYGAIRIAMKHPDLFNSVSAIDAPLAFGQGNMQQLFQRYLTESNITSAASYLDTDTTAFRVNKQQYKILLYSMAASFSPAPYSIASKFDRLQIALPFDYTGTTVQSVWNQWMANDLYTWLDDQTYRTNLAGQNIHLEYSDHDINMFNDQTAAFSAKLNTAGIDHELATFSKYPGYEAHSRSFLYDRLVGILKYHNRFLRDRNGNY